MSELIFKLVYLAGIVVEIAIRAPYNRRWRENKIVSGRVNRREALLLALFILGNFFLPSIYILTPWLNFANYQLPGWAGWLGITSVIPCTPRSGCG
jgi:hypothetical protein